MQTQTMSTMNNYSCLDQGGPYACNASRWRVESLSISQSSDTALTEQYSCLDQGRPYACKASC